MRESHEFVEFGPKLEMLVRRALRIRAGEPIPAERAARIRKICETVRGHSENDLIGLEHLTGLSVLNLGGSAISDQGLRWIANHVGLRTLNLGGTQVGSEGMAHLACRAVR